MIHPQIDLGIVQCFPLTFRFNLALTFIFCCCCFCLFVLFIFGGIGSSLLRVGFSLVVESGGYSLLQCMGFSLWQLLLLQSTGSRHAGFSSCGTQAQQLWRTGLVAPRHVESSWTRARTHVPCIGWRILNHCATREVLTFSFLGLTMPSSDSNDKEAVNGFKFLQDVNIQHRKAFLRYKGQKKQIKDYSLITKCN